MSHKTYPDNVSQGRSLLLLDLNVVRGVTQQAVSIESNGLMQLPAAYHNIKRAFSGY